ncbi:MAG: hypothetical protein PHR77_02585 [Kiritimatiellae bacterium]|nr:hypothetical protein [Kiritimatiellia bacterium]MDD5523360.1 hypothetical protein [Kiritimatiellia bacterium]
MKNINVGMASVFALVLWILSIVTVFAQDPPASPIAGYQSVATSIVKTVEMATVPVVANVKTVETATVSVITGKVSVVRDDATYKVQKINILADDGRTYNVLLDGQGKKLLRVLKSRIVKVTGEPKEHDGKSLFVVRSSEVIGTADKTEVAVIPEVNSLTEPKPESRVEVKPETANASNSVALIKPATNVEARVEIKPVTNNVETKTNAVISVQSNSVPPVIR